MKKVNVAVVSHGHFDELSSNCKWKEFSRLDTIRVCILDNVGEPGLDKWAKSNGMHYIKNSAPRGFGENNNTIFRFFAENKMCAEYFLVLNPDVAICPTDIESLICEVEAIDCDIATINLFKDSSYTTFDESVRSFPTFLDFFSSFFLGVNDTIIDKEGIKGPISVDWAAGSFLLFKDSLYKKLAGFDEKFYMYCEDIDICARAKYHYNKSVCFFPEIKACHRAGLRSRRLFSKHFYWHIRSALRFLTKKQFYKKHRSVSSGGGRD